MFDADPNREKAGGNERESMQETDMSLAKAIACVCICAKSLVSPCFPQRPRLALQSEQNKATGMHAIT
jgi:hypothetical protein